MIKILNRNDRFPNFIVNHYPNLKAKIIGSGDYSNVKGTVEFFETRYGIIIVSEIFNLPTENQDENFFGLRVNIDSSRVLKEETRNRQTFDDLPDLLSNNGYSYSIVLSNYFSLNDILSKQVEISRNRRDTQDNRDRILVASGIITR